MERKKSILYPTNDYQKADYWNCLLSSQTKFNEIACHLVQTLFGRPTFVNLCSALLKKLHQVLIVQIENCHKNLNSVLDLHIKGEVQ